MSSPDKQSSSGGGGRTDQSAGSSPGGGDPSLVLSRPHLSATRYSGAMNIRQTILDAVETLEEENDDLRRVNNRMLSEMEQLRAENDQLRKDLDSALQDHNDALYRADDLTKDNRELEEKLQLQTRCLADESRKFYALESNFKQENEKMRKQCENWRSECAQRDNDVRTLRREVDTLNNKLEKASKRHQPGQDVESFHEIEMLKSERKDLIGEKDELHKLNKKLANDIKQLESALEGKMAELRNENRRHSLLTKEFNSLLEENNHLKLQLRRRRQAHGTHPSAVSQKEDSVTESVVTELMPITSGSPHVRRNNSNVSLHRDTSFSSLSSVIDNVPKILPRDRPLQSRDRARNAADKLTPKGSHNSSPTMNTTTIQNVSEHEFIFDKFGDRKQMPRKSTVGSRSDSDSSPPPEGLPYISGGKTWRP